MPNLSKDRTGGTRRAARHNAMRALGAMESAVTSLMDDEARIGSWVRRLEAQKPEAAVDEVNRRASLSTIEDADLAWEQVELTKLQIFQRTVLAILTQANTAPASVLALFGNG